MAGRGLGAEEVEAMVAAPKSKLVDLHNGTVSRDIFVSGSVYRQELDNIFPRSWLFVGHESQVPKPGDYFVSLHG